MARKNTVSSKNCFFVKNKPEIDTNWKFSSKITFVSWKTRRTREGGKKKEREGQKRRWGQTEKVNILFMFSKLRSFFYFIKYYYSSQSYNKETKHTHIHKSGKKRENLLFFCFRATKIVCLYNFFFFVVHSLFLVVVMCFIATTILRLSFASFVAVLHTGDETTKPDDAILLQHFEVYIHIFRSAFNFRTCYFSWIFD